jgi:hypothetical protein
VALASAVAGIFVNMYRPKTVRAMVAGGRSERLYLASAMTADESRVVFGESFVFEFHFFASFLSFLKKALYLF